MTYQSTTTAIPVEVAILLDDHADRVHRVRSVLWAASNLIRHAALNRSAPHSLVVELSQLIDTGLKLADDFYESLNAEIEPTATSGIS